MFFTAPRLYDISCVTVYCIVIRTNYVVTRLERDALCADGLEAAISILAAFAPATSKFPRSAYRVHSVGAPRQGMYHTCSIGRVKPRHQPHGASRPQVGGAASIGG